MPVDDTVDDRSSNALWILLAILIVLAIGGLMYYSSQTTNSDITSTTTVNRTEIVPVPVPGNTNINIMPPAETAPAEVTPSSPASPTNP